MKLAVLSDIHGNLVALEAALTDLEAFGEVDMIWVLGDIAALGPRPIECTERVKALQEQHGKEKFKVVGGNTDRYLITGERFPASPAEDEDTFKQQAMAQIKMNHVYDWTLGKLNWENYEFLKGIVGRETSLKADGYGYVIGYHAIPGNDESMALRPDTPDEEAADALLDREGRLGIGGHTHLQMDRDLGRWRAINVGSIGMSFDMPGKAQWGLFTFEDGNLTVNLRAVPYDTAAAIEDLKVAAYPEVDWAIDRLQIG